MSFNSGPEFLSGPEREPGLSAIERLDLLAEIAARSATIAHELGAVQVNQDPVLHAMLSKVIEGGPELDPTHQSFLRKMIALRLNGLPEDVAKSETDYAFYSSAAQTVRGEIEELRGMLGEDRLTDPWDAALQDLTDLDGQ